METAKKTTRKSSPKAGADQVRAAYIEYVLVNGKRPPSVYKFCLDLGIKEDEFYSFAGSFDGLEKMIWKGYADTVISRLHQDDSFFTFSTREKILAFYYSLLELLKQNRSYVLFQLDHSNRPSLVPEYIKGFKESFETFFEGILMQGKGSGEVANRPVLDKRYPQLFWLHMGFIIMFWKNDDSPDFEKTDAAVEKSVNLAFDLIGKGAVDSAIDFAKFLYQNNMR